VIELPTTAAIKVATGLRPTRIPAGTTAIASIHGIAPAMNTPINPRFSISNT
jgi:hypothetical protein